jgi:ketosteroid isomerase-like protein
MLAIASFLSVVATFAQAAAADTAREQVWASELAFAHTMAERNPNAFGEFLAEEAVFFDGASVLHGKATVIEAWSKLFSGPEAPFSWEPDQVEVLASGTLALSTGPVRNPAGKIVARFNTIWRLESQDRWKVVFDKGSPPSPGPD